MMMTIMFDRKVLSATDLSYASAPSFPPHQVFVLASSHAYVYPLTHSTAQPRTNPPIPPLMHARMRSVRKHATARTRTHTLPHVRPHTHAPAHPRARARPPAHPHVAHTCRHSPTDRPVTFTHTHPHSPTTHTYRRPPFQAAWCPLAQPSSLARTHTHSHPCTNPTNDAAAASSAV